MITAILVMAACLLLLAVAWLRQAQAIRQARADIEVVALSVRDLRSEVRRG
jgi:hypothetical protein